MIVFGSVIWLNILILEDNSYIRQFLKRILPLRYSQIVIFESNTVHEAIQLISEIDFQVALIDFNFPDGLGTELLKYLLNDCITLGMSGEKLSESICNRFTHFFLKPFQIQDLVPPILPSFTNLNTRGKEKLILNKRFGL